MKMLPLWMDGVQVWLGEDYGLYFEGENVTAHAVLEALCFLKGCMRGGIRNWRNLDGN